VATVNTISTWKRQCRRGKREEGGAEMRGGREGEGVEGKEGEKDGRGI
jgi:hypothetical protein